ncbi:MAG: hypothetical protein GX458_01250 [Phyllobacteriaceae bacterium]|nr:hypothetical protein [Phyllobacteriaceae bacterium]
MAKITVHAGDFPKGGNHSLSWGNFSMSRKGKILPETIPLKELASVEVASEQSVKKLAGAAGWATVGAIALGPIGLLAGALVGGNKKEVTFTAEFKDGRRMLATTDNKTFLLIQGAVFQ